MSMQELAPILQVAVGPAILISAVGLLLLTMTNRLGRVIDRSRQLVAHASAASPGAVAPQLDILLARARVIRLAIALATASALCAAAIVITLFLAAVYRWEAAALAVALFVGCLAALIGSLVAFLWDVNMSLAALKLELASARQRAR